MTVSRGETDFQAIGDLLAEAGLPAGTGASPETEAAGRRQGRPPSAARRLAAVWAEAVGQEIAQHAQPRQLRNGRLWCRRPRRLGLRPCSS